MVMSFELPSKLVTADHSPDHVDGLSTGSNGIAQRDALGLWTLFPVPGAVTGYAGHYEMDCVRAEEHFWADVEPMLSDRLARPETTD